MKIHLRKLLAVLLVIAALFQLALSAMASVSVKVNASTKAYKSASTSSASVSIAKGTKLTMLSYSGGWAKVSCNGKTGYIQLKYLNTTTRYPAYVNKNTYIYASASSSSTKKSVSVNTKVYVIGISGSYYRVQNASGSVTAYIPKSCLSKNKVSVKTSSSGSSSSWKSKVVKLDWYNGGSSVLKTGRYGYIYDIKSGITVKIKRMGGSNHADVEPATAADTAKLLRISGGRWTWDSHAVILYAGGKYVACAINTYPHGDQTITDNNYEGQFCLHMVNSRTHGTDNVNTAHQSAINAAYSWAH